MHFIPFEVLRVILELDLHTETLDNVEGDSGAELDIDVLKEILVGRFTYVSEEMLDIEHEGETHRLVQEF